jgi:integrase
VIHVRQTVIPVRGGVQIGPTKSGHSRTIHGLFPSVLAALREHKAQQNERRLALGELWRDHELVFCSEVGTPIQPSNLRRNYERLLQQAGVPHITTHNQRHTNASLLIQMGIDPKVVSERLGHAQTSITMGVYHHVSERQHEEAGDRLGAVLFAPPQSGDEAAGCDKARRTQTRPAVTNP